MTYQTATAKLISICESTAAAPTSKKLGFGTKFIHDAAAADDKLPGARHFWLRTVSGSIKGPLAKTTRRRMADIELSVFYPASADQRELDLVIQSDYKALSEKIVDPTLYAVATSGLVAVSSGGTFIIPFQVQDVAEGHMLVMRFPVEYKE